MKKNIPTDMPVTSRPQAEALVSGSGNYADINGTVDFYQANNGVMVAVSIVGLPQTSDACGGTVFGFHIHEGSDCSPGGAQPYEGTMGHYNPGGCPHPYHAGDMPPLFANGGYAFMVFLTDRFTIDEIIGKTVVIHSAPDDFTTQPSGNSGIKIACGVIEDLLV